MRGRRTTRVRTERDETLRAAWAKDDRLRAEAARVAQGLPAKMPRDPVLPKALDPDIECWKEYGAYRCEKRGPHAFHEDRRGREWDDTGRSWDPMDASAQWCRDRATKRAEVQP